MTLSQRISIAYHRGLTHLNSFLFSDPTSFSNGLIAELTRYFLSDAIEDRVRYLSDGDEKEEEKFRREVVSEYNKRVEEAVRRELTQNSHHLVEENLSSSALPVQLSDELLASADRLMVVLRRRCVFVPGQLSEWDAKVVFGILLRAIQRVALDIIRVDYPSKGNVTKVPASAQEAVRQALRKITNVAQTVQSPIEIKSAARAETELRVLVARARAGACLPLRAIPTAPLASDDLENHYVARPDSDALQLARQIRHADGTILVTGYRGVGKSSFVNRVIYHAISAQNDNPADGWLLVPITVNLAKVAGVQNILRLTLRAVREALLDTDTGKARPVPSSQSGKLKNVPLPLDQEREIERLEEAYIRATYKVTMTRANTSENKWEAASSISLDPGKILGKVAGLELGKFLEAGVKKTRSERINRELNLLDYDENAAEDDLSRLIRSLARKRPLYGTGEAEVRIKLVFIFDELDKMDIEKGLKPMIEGLKNLFLQQHSVFVLVTSKSFYYELLKNRAVEDAMLNSYFSAIVHVPLLTFTEANRLVGDWVDVEATEQLKSKSPAEIALIEQLTRFLLYKSSGNPRDIIRELRLMQEWAKDADQPYLTDELAKSPALKIFATIQECIEKTAIPKDSSPTNLAEGDGSVTLVADGLVGKEARAEQIRRGLYTLMEELIVSGSLVLEPTPENEPPQQPAPAPVTRMDRFEDLLKKLVQPQRGTSELSPFLRIYKDNFSLFSVDEVRDYVRRLGIKLQEHLNSSKFSEQGPMTLFMMDGTNVLRFEQPFFELAERQPSAPTLHTPAETKIAEVIIAEAEELITHADWPSKLSAINLIGRIVDAKPSDTLRTFLWNVVETDPDPNHRQAAAVVIKDGIFEVDKERVKLIETEKDESVLLRLVALLKTADDGSKKLATDTILNLIERDKDSTRRMSESIAVESLNALAVVADRDVSDELFGWLSSVPRSELVQREIVNTLKAQETKYSVDIASKIISDSKILGFFVGSMRPLAINAVGLPITPSANPVLKNYLRELLRSDPLRYAKDLLERSGFVNVADLLSYIWDFAYETRSDGLARFIFDELLASEESANTIKKQVLRISLLNTAEFQTRLLAHLNRKLPELRENFMETEVETLRRFLKELESAPANEPPKLDPFADFLKSTKLGQSITGGNLTSHRVPRDWRRTIGYAVLSLVSFALGIFFFRRDLPAGATVATMIQSRVLLLLANGVILYPYFYSRATGESLFNSKINSNFIFASLVPIIYVLYYLHNRYIGPATFGNQVLQFLVNLPTLASAFLAFYRERVVTPKVVV